MLESSQLRFTSHLKFTTVSHCWKRPLTGARKLRAESLTSLFTPSSKKTKIVHPNDVTVTLVNELLGRFGSYGGPGEVERDGRRRGVGAGTVAVADLRETVACGVGEILEVLDAVGVAFGGVFGEELLEAVDPAVEGEAAFVLEGGLERDPHGCTEQHPAREEDGSKPEGEAERDGGVAVQHTSRRSV